MSVGPRARSISKVIILGRRLKSCSACSVLANEGGAGVAPSRAAGVLVSLCATVTNNQPISAAPRKRLCSSEDGSIAGFDLMERSLARHRHSGDWLTQAEKEGQRMAL